MKNPMKPTAAPVTGPEPGPQFYTTPGTNTPRFTSHGGTDHSHPTMGMSQPSAQPGHTVPVGRFGKMTPPQ